MLHPIFTTILGRPDLVVEHVANYGALIRQEVHDAGRGVLTRVIAGAIAAVAALLALGFIGVALMLGFLHGSFHWVLVIVPGAAILIAGICGYVATRPSRFTPFSDLKAQMNADVQAMHLAGERRGR